MVCFTLFGRGRGGGRWVLGFVHAFGVLPLNPRVPIGCCARGSFGNGFFAGNDFRKHHLLVSSQAEPRI